MAKTIKLISGERFSSERAFIEVLSQAPQGCNIDQMRKRMRVIDAIEAAHGADEVTLEDADYELLKSVYVANQFPLVHRELLAIADTLA